MRSTIFVIAILVFIASVAGCAYSTQSALPASIKTIEVTTFGNSTYYNQLEGTLTREIIKAINLSPRLKVVNKNGDAILSGSIFKVANTGLSYDSKFQPRELSTVISANFSLYDNAEGYFVINNRTISSNSDSSTAGRFDTAKNEVYATAQEKALAELAQSIVRSMVDNW